MSVNYFLCNILRVSGEPEKGQEGPALSCPLPARTEASPAKIVIFFPEKNRPFPPVIPSGLLWVWFCFYFTESISTQVINNPVKERKWPLVILKMFLRALPGGGGEISTWIGLALKNQ